MANISNWLAAVSSRVPGASKTEVDSAVITIIREFCDKTLLYVKKLTAINVVVGVREYTLTAPTDCSIVGVDHATLNDMPISATSMDLLNRSPEPWMTQQASEPNVFMVDAEKVLSLKQLPEIAYTGGLVVWAAVKPTPTATTIPDFIYDDWFETILNGAVAYLLKTPGKSWTSLEGSKFFDDYYTGEMSTAKSKKYTGKAKVSIRSQPPPFSVIG